MEKSSLEPAQAVAALNDGASGSGSSGNMKEDKKQNSSISKLLRDKKEMLEFGKLQKLKVSSPP